MSKEINPIITVCGVPVELKEIQEKLAEARKAFVLYTFTADTVEGLINKIIELQTENDELKK